MSSVPITLSTSSVYPSGTATGFELAKKLGYDGVEVMVGIDDVSADVTAIKALSRTWDIPVRSVHAPCLLVTQRVWGTEPWGKLHRAAEMAFAVGAEIVVVHPPFRWQREYGRGFVEGIARLEDDYDISFCVENMYPWRTGRRPFQAYSPSWDPAPHPYEHTTLDVSHASTSQVNPVELAKQLGDRLTHLHLTDGTGSVKDEHLIPGRGTEPVAELLQHLAATSFTGDLVLEVNTRKSGGPEGRERDLIEALEFARRHFVAPSD